MAHMLNRKFSCPVELTLEILSGKWKTIILAHLKEQPLHYAELHARIPSLSDKVLTQRLNDLEELGLIVRHKEGRRGARAWYELSDRGKSLRPALQILFDWGLSIASEVGATIEPPSGAR